jgi:GT2 family glycosyltransferase
MSRAADLTVIIPTHDRPDVLARNLRALDASEEVDLARVQVIVVDDGSPGQATGRTLDALRRDLGLELEVITQANAGQAAARNRAMERAHGAIWLFLNDDTIPTPGLLAAHLRAHAAHPEEQTGILGHATLAPEIPLTTARSLHLDHMWRRLRGRTELEWHEFWTTNVSVKAAFLRRHDLAFDPAIRYVHDDTEMGQRLAARGFRLRYEPAAVGYHDHAIGEDDLLRMAEREAASLVYWARKRPDTAAALARFGYTPAKRAWERRFKYPLLAVAFNRGTEPLWRAGVRCASRLAPGLARFLLSQCYAARKRRAIARLRAADTGPAA